VVSERCLRMAALWGSPAKPKEKGPARNLAGPSDLAEWTGLEPATPGVTGRYSNQLNYHSW
jgi:hypothetical protein